MTEQELEEARAFREEMIEAHIQAGNDKEDIVGELKQYLANTPREQQEKDWQNICKDIPVNSEEEFG